jgi:glycosyltransferase involved in cell wall biosynthesis
MQPSIGIDYTSALSQGGGIGRYTRELIAALAALDRDTPYVLFAAGQTRRALPPSPGSNFAWKPALPNSEWLARLWHRARLPLPVETWTGRVGLFHSPDFTLPPLRRGTRSLLTVHDLSFVRAPQTATAGLRAYLNSVVPRSVLRADLVLADSEATRQDILDLYRTPPDKVSVLYSGVDGRFQPVTDQAARQALRVRYAIGDGPYILSLGTVQPRKNYPRLIEAFRQLDDPDLKLVIAGGRGWLDSPLYELVRSARLEKRVQFLGFVADEDLPALYSAAGAFAFPSLYEGFGLPVLEAMACGVPVVTSNVSSLPEVAGEAALLVDPQDVTALAEALSRALTDDKQRQLMIRRGLARVKLFTWEAAAARLKDHYVRLLSE